MPGESTSMVRRSVTAVGRYPVSQTRSGPGVTITPSRPTSRASSTTRAIRAV